MSGSLQELRDALADLLETGLDIPIARFGANANPPCIIVRSGNPYLTTSGYGTDHINFEVLLLVGRGSPEAQADTLDELIDQVRFTLLDASYEGYRFGFQSVDEVGIFNDKDQQIPATRVMVMTERQMQRDGSTTP